MPAVQIKDADFEQEVLKSDLPVLVDFFATWCGPCRMMGPIIDELSEEYVGKVKIFKMDVDEAQQTATKYGIQSIPTLIFFKAGQPADSAIGFQSKDALKSKLDAL
ncbi:MAG: thioredoxin, thioredoxin 1 [Candidatus Peregrinibacteria bacterium GW2011_GWC2_39_14]|nr:MAG: lpbca thioredoxin [Candidatus Peregrinibacteria bacterium GW2011_GWA2_38_36]KKR06555.1 MAG: thioredoxin, thioredoxin 1 [Candidatus Peregrinibacteria bacterium GW2011_GWC2_39_14]